MTRPAYAVRKGARTEPPTVAVVDRHPKFGQEVSSHNSEVIHAGIYYKATPLKSSTCIRGKELLYPFCERYSVAYKRCGKYIVATDPSQLAKLHEIAESAKAAGVVLNTRSPAEIARLLNNSHVLEALWSDSTGIVDSHSLMYRLETLAQMQGALLLYGYHYVRGLSRGADNLEVEIRDPSQAPLRIRARHVINCGGLGAGTIAHDLWPELQAEIRPCRGRYFSLSSRWTDKYQSLIYPIPDPRGGLGVHLTFDLTGKSRLGPDVHWPKGFDSSTPEPRSSSSQLKASQPPAPDDMKWYEFDSPSDLLRKKFFEAGRKLLPDLELNDLSPDYVGVRPKLFIKQKAHPDFFVQKSPHGPDWHLLGIESPGLTSALALAESLTHSLANGLDSLVTAQPHTRQP